MYIYTRFYPRHPLELWPHVTFMSIVRSCYSFTRVFSLTSHSFTRDKSIIPPLRGYQIKSHRKIPALQPALPTEKEARFTAASFSILLHLQEFQDLFQRMKSCDSPEYLLTVHNQHGGYLHDLKLFCQLWFFVHIDFAEFHIAGFLRCLF